MVQTPSANDTFFGLDISDIKRTFSNIRRKISKRYLLIEFGVDSLTYGEAKVAKDQVYFSKINRISLDKSAIEKGTPSDPDAMSSFLREIIEEEQIWAHRVGITIPPQAALSKLIYLPENLNYQEAIEHISNPSSSGFQFPISIENTDFDIIPLNIFSTYQEETTKAYFLSSVPKKLVDNIVTTVAKAELELHYLDIAYSSLERLAITSIDEPKENEVFILVELSKECTHFYIVGFNGPIYVTTLAAIKTFDVKDDYKGAISIEEDTINSEEYLAISELDLKILFSEIQDVLDQFKKYNDLAICEIVLTGINSSHPGIKNLFKDRFKLKTSILRSISSKEIGDINLSKPIVMQDLNRLIGLGLNMIQSIEIELDDYNKNKIEYKNGKAKKKFHLENKSIANFSNKNLDNNNNMSKAVNNLNNKELTSNKEDISHISFEQFLTNLPKKENNKTNTGDSSIKLIASKTNINSKNQSIKDDSIIDSDNYLEEIEINKILEKNTNINNNIQGKSDLISNKEEQDDSLLDFETDFQKTKTNKQSENNPKVNKINLGKSDMISNKEEQDNSLLDFETDFQKTKTNTQSENNPDFNNNTQNYSDSISNKNRDNPTDTSLNDIRKTTTDSDQKNSNTNKNLEEDFYMPDI